jgi:glycosyltransferase involved in cell wall biosynthesis
MRILFNATAALAGTSGAIHTVGLLSQLAALSDHEFVLLTTPAQQFLRDRLGDRVGHHIMPDRGGALARTAWLQARLGAVQRATGATALYNKGNFYALSGRRQICFVENTNPFSTLDLGAPLAYRARNHLLRLISDQALLKAAAAVFPTEHARELISLRSKTRAPQFVVPYGCELPDGPAAPAARPYVLCISSLLPYKNLPLAIDAFAELRRRHGFDGEFRIVGVSGIAGAGEYSMQIRKRIESLGLADAVQLVPPVGPEQLPGLYRGAACLLMPSLEESFGIPLIEAMGLGTPVAAAAVEGEDRYKYFIPFREICGPAAEYFSPFDAADCAAAMARTVEPSRRAELIALGHARAARYSWRAAAAGTLRVIDSLG